MSDSPAILTLRNAVMSYFARSPLDTKYLEKAMVIAVELLGDLNIYNTSCPNSAYLDVSDVNICSLPPDYISMINPPCVIVGNRKHELSEDDSIPLDTPLDCGNETNPQPIGNNEGSHFPLYRNKHGFGQYGSHPVRNIAFYRIDKRRRIIRLRGHIPTSKLYIEYSSTGISIDGNTFIPRELLPVFRTYLAWQMEEYDLRIAANEKERKKDQYEKALSAYHHWKESFSVKEFVDIIRRNYSQSVKG